MAKSAYEHVPYVDPDLMIREGLGWFFRYRGLGTQVVLDIGIVAIVKYVLGNWVVVAGAAFFLLSVLLASWRERVHRLNMMNLAQALHNVAHCMRDATKELPLAYESGHGDYSVYDSRYKSFNEDIADRIARYFELLIRERSVGCAIRCACLQNSEVVFRTIARSQMLLKDKRHRLSKPIPSEKGVARMLRQRDQYGVLFVWDIKKAGENEDVWYKTPTDELPDVKEVMVAPINGYVRGEREMLGLLYITTKKKKLEKKYAEHLMSFSDMLGLVYPAVTEDVGNNVGLEGER